MSHIAGPPTSIISLMIHYDCGEFLTSDGLCPNCNFHPDMQSTGFRNMSSSFLLLREGHTFLGSNRRTYAQPKLIKKRDPMTDESKPSTVEINGGVLTRAAKSQKCNCNLPDMKTNAIESGDEWTCSCGQGWRARPEKTEALIGTLYWRRIAKRTSKESTGTPTESE